MKYNIEDTIDFYINSKMIFKQFKKTNKEFRYVKYILKNYN